MISVFIGENTQMARKEAKEVFLAATHEAPEALIVRYDDVSFDAAGARDALSSENLFGAQNIIFFDGILEHPDGESFYRTALKKTEHVIIVRESTPPADLIEFFKRIGEVAEFPLRKPVEKKINSFAIADAIGRRDKKGAWVEFEYLRRTGVPAEEVHGTIFWAVKSMFLCANLSRDDALKTGMKEFTYRNYSQFAKKYLSGELSIKLADLKDMYHRSHRGEGELDILLEQFLLKL